MVVEAKFETMITNDSCFVAVSCLVVFCCWKLNYSSFHIPPFFPGEQHFIFKSANNDNDDESTTAGIHKFYWHQQEIKLEEAL